MSKKIVGVIILLVLAVTFIVGCSKQEASVAEQPASKIAEIKAAGKIVLGTAADYPPYEFHSVINGQDEIIGFDIEIAKEIAKTLGVKLEIKDMKFNGLLAALKAGNIDFIVAGMVPTEERKQSVDFSKSYYQAEQTFLTKLDKVETYQTVDDLKNLKVGVQKATIQEKIAKEKIANAELKSLSKITDLVLELKNNKIDGIVLVKPVASAYAKANSDLEVAKVSFGKEAGVAIAVEHNSPELLQVINQTLDQLMAEDKINQFIRQATEQMENN